jgi:hypothetical protein
MQRNQAALKNGGNPVSRTVPSSNHLVFFSLAEASQSSWFGPGKRIQHLGSFI